MFEKRWFSGTQIYTFVARITQLEFHRQESFTLLHPPVCGCIALRLQLVHYQHPFKNVLVKVSGRGFIFICRNRQMELC